MFIAFVIPVIERILNRFLALDPESKHRLDKLSGKAIAIELSQTNTRIYFVIEAQYIRLLNHFDGVAEVVLTGTPFDFMRLGFAKNDSAAVFASNVTIFGNSEIAQEFKKIFADLDVDWEEQLSHVTGDVLAYQVGNAVRAFAQWAKQTSDTLQQNFSEYIQEEAQLLPSRLELQDFFAEVDQLRDEVERLVLRIEKLKNLSI